ncbi:MAG: glycosyltransferase family 9 protein [candidate division Zixibacteria bacterium]|nr:glycosyltransferase family 9 protein [candidate division Zixibacteria bacterium]
MKLKKILIIRLNAMGDVILALPVAMAIKDAYPAVTVDFVTRKAYAPLFDQFPAVDTAFAFDQSMRELLKELKKQKYDTVIDLQKNPRSLILSAGINPKNVVSYPKRRFKRELIVRQSLLKLNAGHTVDAYLKALSRLKINPLSRRPRVELQPEIAKFGDSFISNAKFTGKIIGLCPGSKHEEKKWPQYQQLAELLIGEDDKNVIVFSGPADRFDPNLNISSDKLVAAHKLPIDRVAGVMSKCDLVVTNDSGLMHLAVALSVPVVAIFGPTHPSLGFSPLGDYDKVVCDNVECSPCSLHGEKKCKMPRKFCFENISPELVKSELDKTLYVEIPSQIL